MALASVDRLIGRARELEVLRHLVTDLRRGVAATVFLEGEAGIGKTHLLGALIEIAREGGVPVLAGEAHALERTRPFGALVEALDLRPGSADPRRAAIGRVLAERDPGDAVVEAGQFRVADQIVELLEVLAERGPVLLALEDVHWADSSTLLVLRWVIRRLGDAPLMLIATLRPSPRTSELEHVLGDALGSGAQLIRLDPLDDREVEALVRAELGARPGPALAEAVARAGGNPLWVLEMLRAMSAEGRLDLTGPDAEVAGADLPESLRQLVVRRLAYLPERVVGLLRIASILGDHFSLADLATVTGRSVVELVSDLDEAFRARVVGEQGAAVVFRHALVQEAVYLEVPEPVRVALHREAGRALGAAGAPLTQVASHVYLGAVAGDLEAVSYLREAARETLARAPGVAVELLRRVESLLPDGHPQRDEVMVELVRALLRAGQVAEAAGIAEAVLARPHASDADGPLRLSLVEALSLQNRGPELVELGEATLAGAALAPGERAFVLAQTSYGHTFSGDPVAGEQTARRALAIAEQERSTAMTVWSLTTLSVAVKTQGRYGEALELTQRAVRLSFEPADPEARLRHPHFFHGLALCDADRMEEAGAAYRTAARECDELGSAWILPDTRLMSAELRFLLGEWDVAVPELEAGLEAAADHGTGILVAQSRGYLAMIATARGDRRAAAAALAPVEGELERDAPCYGAEIVALAASMLAEAAGRPAAALEMLRRVWRHDAARGSRYHCRQLAPVLVRLALDLGEHGFAREVAGAAAEAAALAPEVPTVRSAALRCRNLIERDADAMVEAVALARRGRRMLDHAGACEDAARVLASSGRLPEARELLDEALDRYEDAGAAWLAARAGAQLRAVGGRRGSRGSRRRGSTGWDSLTRGERAVADLVAQGLTNRAVAERLYVSPHTVNSHLRHIFRKLGVSTRARLAAMAVERDPQDHAFE